MSHKIILNKSRGSGAAALGAESADVIEYSVTYEPPHDLPLAEQNERIVKIRKHLAKIEAIANGEPTE